MSVGNIKWAIRIAWNNINYPDEYIVHSNQAWHGYDVLAVDPDTDDPARYGVLLFDTLDDATTELVQVMEVEFISNDDITYFVEPYIKRYKELADFIEQLNII